MLSRIKRQVLQLDAFPKVSAEYQQASEGGGLITLIVVLILCFLVSSEYREYSSLRHHYNFLVDREVYREMQINLDVTVAMPCEFLNVDVLDATGAHLNAKKALTSNPAKFEVGTAHLLEKVLGDQVPTDLRKAIRDARKKLREKPVPKENADACRIFGSIEVNKVMGNLHITALGHGHGGTHVDHDRLNFTHRIDDFSFGENFPNIRNPLDNVIESTDNNMQRFQYFISVVPTTYMDASNNILRTNQYAVSDHNKNIGTSGVPGVFFKYDIEPILIQIHERRSSFLHFLVRLSGIVGGIWVCAGMGHKFLSAAWRVGKPSPMNGTRPLLRNPNPRSKVKAPI
ncbi:uncharacterized protein VTP21DRAFT_602 [Calcarisporiella thermophila]|uniref:uncharacterized protein n=1 Tax=Calcarisporiella thermophila TaxID=911321 RepID=UPI003742CBAC